MTTTLTNWMNATTALDLVPQPTHYADLAARFVNLCGKIMLTQRTETGREREECWLSRLRAVIKASFQCREALVAFKPPVKKPLKHQRLGRHDCIASYC